MSDEKKDVLDDVDAFIVDMLNLTKQVYREVKDREDNFPLPQEGGVRLVDWFQRFWKDPLMSDPVHKGMLIAVILLLTGGEYGHPVIDKLYTQLTDIREKIFNRKTSTEKAPEKILH